ncbi:MAG: hypothetical protein IID51_03735 [Proteobacteria bacterium]|nr:hypothetical protein [Pseudomonadota bacterium]
MILNLLSLAFFILLWLMATKGLVDAAGPFTRRLSVFLMHLEQHGAPGGHRAGQVNRTRTWLPTALS